jgi:hypothetical protein
MGKPEVPVSAIHLQALGDVTENVEENTGALGHLDEVRTLRTQEAQTDHRDQTQQQLPRDKCGQTGVKIDPQHRIALCGEPLLYKNDGQPEIEEA